MFRQPIFTNLRFTMIQAVNPFIQNSSNKFIGKTAGSLLTGKTKSVLNLPKKLLGKDLKLTNQPSTDVVVLSSDAKTAVLKRKNGEKSANGKSIKNVLNKYFNNDDISADFQKDKKANLKQLVEEFEHEQYNKYDAPREKAMKLMQKDAERYHRMELQSIAEEENENRELLNLYLNQFQDLEEEFALFPIQ